MNFLTDGKGFCFECCELCFNRYPITVYVRSAPQARGRMMTLFVCKSCYRTLAARQQQPEEKPQGKKTA